MFCSPNKEEHALCYKRVLETDRCLSVELKLFHFSHFENYVNSKVRELCLLHPRLCSKDELQKTNIIKWLNKCVKQISRSNESSTSFVTPLLNWGLGVHEHTIFFTKFYRNL
jgi:hypothetical protein